MDVWIAIYHSTTGSDEDVAVLKKGKQKSSNCRLYNSHLVLTPLSLCFHFAFTSLINTSLLLHSFVPYPKSLSLVVQDFPKEIHLDMGFNFLLLLSIKRAS